MTTINELREWCKENNISGGETHLYIDEISKDPKAYGIYIDEGEYVVYWTNGEGTRLVAYRGEEEAEAVKKLLLIHNSKLEEIKREAEEREEKAAKEASFIKKRNSSNKAVLIFAYIFAGIMVIPQLFFILAGLFAGH